MRMSQDSAQVRTYSPVIIQSLVDAPGGMGLALTIPTPLLWAVVQ